MITRRAALLGSTALPFAGSAFLRPAAAQQPSTLRIAMTLADIPVTDGAPDQGTEGIRFMGYTLYDPLVMWDLSSATEPAKLVPGLATSWKQDPADPSKWIFELRQGVKFHDGSTFNADAVVFNLDRVFDEKSPAFDRMGRGILIAAVWPITGYRKLDEYKVELQTDGEYTLLPALLNRFTLASPANFEKVGRDWLAYRKSPSGTGPWKMKAWTPRERAELERNTDYWNKDRIPKSERLVLLPVPDVSTRTAALLSGQVDWIEAPAPDSLDKLRAGGVKIETNAIPHMWPYTLSMLPGAPTADIRVRKAMNLAVDRDALVKLLNGLAVPAVGCVPPDHPWFGNPSFKIKYDPEQAKKLLAEAGYNLKDKRLKMKVAISTSGSGQMYPLIMNEFIQQQFAEVGIDLDFQVLDWNALLNLMRKGAKSAEGAPFTAINVSWNTMDPHNAFMRFVDSAQIPPKGSNWGYINDPGFDALAKEARETADPAALDKVLAKINTKMVDDAVFVWFVHDVWPNAISSKVKGYVHPKSWYVDFSPVTAG
ncbi:ABC-type transport system, substrate-binding protein [Enhydrobacter aerosaccus]|uniref:ABC-type transport system, substrate-binding protein n=1 Tax=Enhydrobacter aerosaccus TaxID=225324 RepID=A0A1T4TC53_9HYPH|nr:ABC transporter substrate-binding protein [Enhydrobacter aerosaccus]SKA37977.1 ABC-type transport system, substrate-binding protein [Enhydrobacter aerosaccus]